MWAIQESFALQALYRFRVIRCGALNTYRTWSASLDILVRLIDS